MTLCISFQKPADRYLTHSDYPGLITWGGGPLFYEWLAGQGLRYPWNEWFTEPIMFPIGDVEGKVLENGLPPLRVSPAADRVVLLNSHFGNVRSLFTDWDFARPCPTIGREKPVVHHTAKGSLDLGYGFGAFGAYNTVEYSGNNTGIHGLWPIGDPVVSVPVSGVNHLKEFVNDKPGCSDWSFSQNCVTYRKVREAGILILPDFIEIWASIEEFSPTRRVVIMARLAIQVSFVAATSSALADYVAITQDFSLFWEAGWRDISIPYAGFEDIIGPRRGFSRTLDPLAPPALSQRLSLPPLLVGTSGGFAPLSYEAQNLTPYEFCTGDTLLARFVRENEVLVPDAFGLAGFASNDALSNFSASFGMNQFENVEGLTSLFGLVDTVKLFKTAASYSRSELLRHSLDILCDARLVYSYALSPTVADIRAITGGAKSFRHRWFGPGQFARTPLYGSVTVSVPDELIPSFQGSKVTVRVKIVGFLDPDSILAKLLPLDAVGILPRLSNLWATIPFSFVTDNIFNVSAALKFAEAEAMLFAFREEYSIVSAKFEWKFEEGPLASLLGVDEVQIHSGEASLSSYYRMVQFDRPTIQPTRLGVQLLASHMPSDLMTYGALSYSVIK